MFRAGLRSWIRPDPHFFCGSGVLDLDPHLFADPDANLDLGLELKNGLFLGLRTWIQIRICSYLQIQMQIQIRIFLTQVCIFKQNIVILINF